jgi:hypothetical protein
VKTARAEVSVSFAAADAGQREGEQADDYPATCVTQIVSSPPEYGRRSNQP